MDRQSPGRFRRNAVLVLRWIAFIPLAALAAYLAWVLVNGFNRLNLMMIGANPDGLLNRFFTEVMAGGVMGAAFVYAGTKVAPARKTEVVFVLAGLAILSAGVALYPSIATGAGWAILSGVAIAIGAGLVAWSVHTGETDPDSI